jgi:probable F420-dependent oxidoreductase
MSAISVQAQVHDAKSWAALAVRFEDAGFDSLLVADHPGVRASPFVALAAAAAVTKRMSLGTYVSNVGVRDPFLIASDVATLDVLSGGRARLGLGAGHNPAEWVSVGRRRPDVAGRVQRCIEAAVSIRALLAGELVDVGSDALKVRGQLSAPLPVQSRVPFTVGGSNARLLRWAGRNADVVGLVGTGKTLPDGYSHEVRWSRAEVEAQLDEVRVGAADAVTAPEVEALVQMVVVTSDAEAAAYELAVELGLSVSDVLAAPFVLIGTEDEIVASVQEHRRRWGITRHVVREDGAEALAGFLPRLK